MSKDQDNLLKLGELIRKKAAKKYSSNVEFANVCNISEGMVRRIYSGKQNISLKILKAICDGLDTKVSDLLKEAGY